MTPKEEARHILRALFPFPILDTNVIIANMVKELASALDARSSAGWEECVNQTRQVNAQVVFPKNPFKEPS